MTSGGVFMDYVKKAKALGFTAATMDVKDLVIVNTACSARKTCAAIIMCCPRVRP